nr:hypothetical protein GCM10010200_023280 [Actinomadura rugatobispora]
MRIVGFADLLGGSGGLGQPGAGPLQHAVDGGVAAAEQLGGLRGAPAEDLAQQQDGAGRPARSAGAAGRATRSR